MSVLSLTPVRQAQMNSLAPLKVPRQLLVKKSSPAGEEEGEGEGKNQTDQEKTVLKRTSTLIEVRFS